MKRAWYLGLTPEEIGDRVILIGDPDRVDRLSRLLENPVHHPVSRGLKSVTGVSNGCRITIAAFGMGSPIATIVLHELADLGADKFLRIGTAMYLPPVAPGQLLISKCAIGFEGTSPAYRETGGDIQADAGLAATLYAAAIQAGQQPRTGRYATFDVFYRDMFGIDEAGKKRAEANHRMLADKEVLAVDMETSALLAAASALNVACATLCVGSVNALTREKLPSAAMAEGEKLLFRIALDGLTAI